MPSRSVRTMPEIESAGPALFDPHLGRFIPKIRSMLG
jgi:hypothetical protein